VVAIKLEATATAMVLGPGSQGGSLRAFTGLALQPTCAAGIGKLTVELKELAPRLRWTPAVNYHLTLVFLGNISWPQASLVSDIVADVAARTSSFDLDFDRLCWFPRPSRPRLLALLPRPSAALVNMQAELLGQLKEAGLAPDGKRFRPHITLARVRGKQTLPDLPARVPVLRTDVDSINLYESRQAPEGVRYAVVASGALDNASG
jgi:2'-5' RNA ligase